ncbi:MAG: hypothetical protein Q9207_005886 [Kuettlingeria erythrocarpa]
MTSQIDPEPYVLAYRRNNVEEHRRLDTQHHVIKHAILDGLLIHPSISGVEAMSAIADLGCGTGAWLEDVANTYFAGEGTTKGGPAALVGFDINPLAFSQDLAPGVQLLEHDCTKAFDIEYIGKFDLVNIRGLAFALPGTSFPRLVENAVQLLRPGGYMQWLETDARLWKAYPDTAEISQAREAINLERQERGLVSNLPQFMLRQLLSFNLEADISAYPPREVLTITNFNLLPGGISRESQSQDRTLNQRFSATVLESMKLALDSSLIRKLSEVPDESRGRENGTHRDRLTETQKLIDFIDNTRESGEIMMGGHFPQVIARKSMDL